MDFSRRIGRVEYIVYTCLKLFFVFQNSDRKCEIIYNSSIIKMLIIKLGGSIFAPKHKNYVDLDYLQKFKNFLDQIDDQIILAHGTGNKGHGFVNKYGVSVDTFSIWKNIAKEFFWSIDKIFGYKRLEAEDIIKWNVKIPKNKNIITGWDIDSESLRIISSDEILPFLVGKYNIKNSYMLTDVDGILDSDNNVIPNIDINNLQDIEFWSKEWDVTNSMLGKIQSMKKYISNKNTMWIINGYDLENAENIILNWQWKWTKIS